MRLVLTLSLSAVLLLAVSPLARAEDLYTTSVTGSLVRVDTTDASASLIGSDGIRTRAAAFDLDGTLYTTLYAGRSLGTLDLETGTTTTIGPLLSDGLMDAIEIDAAGRLLGVTQDGRLFTIDKATGTPTLVADVGVTGIMDLAIDPYGTLWAVAENDLYVLDATTGDAVWVGPLDATVEGPVYGIAFGGDGRMWATTSVIDSPLYEVDPVTLDAELVGYTGIRYARGCDIFFVPAMPRSLPVPDTDGDGYPDDVDAFPNSDLRDTVRVGEQDSGVENLLFDDGATLADLVAACAEDADRPGTFVGRVTHLLNELKHDGWITGAEQGAIVRAAARR